MTGGGVDRQAEWIGPAGLGLPRRNFLDWDLMLLSMSYQPYQPGKKGCARCLRQLDFSQFHRNARTLDGLQGWCKECMVASTKAWRARRREAARDG
jgi:hypothetical protein